MSAFVLSLLTGAPFSFGLWAQRPGSPTSPRMTPLACPQRPHSRQRVEVSYLMSKREGVAMGSARPFRGPSVLRTRRQTAAPCSVIPLDWFQTQVHKRGAPQTPGHPSTLILGKRGRRASSPSLLQWRRPRPREADSPTITRSGAFRSSMSRPLPPASGGLQLRPAASSVHENTQEHT